MQFDIPLLEPNMKRYIRIKRIYRLADHDG